MSAKNKYAGLADVDHATPEIYETPELTDDASTVPTNTVRTDSPTPSDEEGDERLDRQRIDQDSARRRFEPSLVNAKDVNFSDTVAAGDRQSYRTRSRRRRRRRHDDGGGDSESEEETLSSKVARLKREAEEVRIQMTRREEEREFKDSVEEQTGAHGETDGMEELDQLLRGLRLPSQSTSGKREEAFLQNLANGKTSTPGTNTTQPPSKEPQSTSSTSAIATFSDRLTALESALDLPAFEPSSSTSILPTLNTLSTQLSILTSTLTSTTPSTSTTTPAQQVNLDTLSQRINALTSEAESLTSARKAALSSLQDLHDARQRYIVSRSTTKTGTIPTQLREIDKQESLVHQEMFLSEQSAKITALYQVLPSITNLQPLLPVVMDRLRSLSVIHAGAADARAELDDVVRRQGEVRMDVDRWRAAVERVEQQMGGMAEGIRENVGVVGDLVRVLEERVNGLGR